MSMAAEQPPCNGCSICLSSQIVDVLITCVLLRPRQLLFHDHQELYIDQCSKSRSSPDVNWCNTVDSARPTQAFEETGLNRVKI